VKLVSVAHVDSLNTAGRPESLQRQLLHLWRCRDLGLDLASEAGQWFPYPADLGK
jgi:hypothetical protein